MISTVQLGALEFLTGIGKVNFLHGSLEITVWTEGCSQLELSTQFLDILLIIFINLLMVSTLMSQVNCTDKTKCKKTKPFTARVNEFLSPHSQHFQYAVVWCAQVCFVFHESLTVCLVEWLLNSICNRIISVRFRVGTFSRIWQTSQRGVW